MFQKLKNKHIQKEIYYQYADYMFVVCFRYMGNKELAEEILNDAFLKAFKNYKSFEPKNKDSLKYWIKRIMINECLMNLRKRKALEFISIDTIPENNDISNNQNSDTTDILSLIKNLPTGYRTVFYLYAIEGFSHKEIAEKLGIKESTSRSQLTMARKLLKEHLINIGYETAG